jgi:hypothetical protein
MLNRLPEIELELLFETKDCNKKKNQPAVTGS